MDESRHLTATYERELWHRLLVPELQVGGWAVVARFPIPWRFQEERVLRCVLAVLMCWAQGEHGPKWLVSVSLREAKADGRLTHCLRWVPKQL